MEEFFVVAVVVSTTVVLLLAAVSLALSISLWRHLRGKPGGELALIMAMSQGTYVMSQLLIVWIAIGILAEFDVDDGVFFGIYAASQILIIVNSLYAFFRVRNWSD